VGHSWYHLLCMGGIALALQHVAVISAAFQACHRNAALNRHPSCPLQVWHAVLGYISGFEEQLWELDDDPAAAARVKAAVAAYKGGCSRVRVMGNTKGVVWPRERRGGRIQGSVLSVQMMGAYTGKHSVPCWWQGCMDACCLQGCAGTCAELPLVGQQSSGGVELQGQGKPSCVQPWAAMYCASPSRAVTRNLCAPPSRAGDCGCRPSSVHSLAGWPGSCTPTLCCGGALQRPWQRLCHGRLAGVCCSGRRWRHGGGGPERGGGGSGRRSRRRRR